MLRRRGSAVRWELTNEDIKKLDETGEKMIWGREGLERKNVADACVSTSIEVEKDGRGDNDGEVEVHTTGGYNEEK